MGTVAFAASGRVPVRPLLTFLQFKMRPDKARTQHLLKMHRTASGQTLFLLGTTHQVHYEDPAYSIWHVKAAVTGLGVDTVFIEMMRDAVDAGRLGEGPVEMPFIATLAQEAGIRVRGIDAGWEGGWQARQARMFAQLQEDLPTTKVGLIASGFMHVQQFREQLEGIGFRLVPWSDEEKRAVLDREVDKTWPRGFRPALEAAIARAKTGHLATDPDRGGDVSWFIRVREQVLAQVPPSSDADH